MNRINAIKKILSYIVPSVIGIYAISESLRYWYWAFFPVEYLESVQLFHNMNLIPIYSVVLLAICTTIIAIISGLGVFRYLVGYYSTFTILGLIFLLCLFWCYEVIPRMWNWSYNVYENGELIETEIPFEHKIFDDYIPVSLTIGGLFLSLWLLNLWRTREMKDLFPKRLTTTANSSSKTNARKA